MVLKKIERSLLVATIALGCVGLLDRMVLPGWRAAAEDLRQRIASEEVNLRMGVAIQGRREAILADQQRYGEFLTAGASDREAVADLLQELEGIAQRSGVAILNLTPQRRSSKGSDQTGYTAYLKAEAGVEQIFNLLHEIQTSRLLITLDQLTLTPKNDEASTMKIETTVRMVVP